MNMPGLFLKSSLAGRMLLKSSYMYTRLIDINRIYVHVRRGHQKLEDLKFIVRQLRGHMWTKKGWDMMRAGVFKSSDFI